MTRVANVVLFHSVYGLRPAVIEAADRFRSAGHTATTPDLYGGTVFGDLAEARGFRDRLGEGTLTRRAWAAGVPAQVHYAVGDPFVPPAEVDGIRAAVTAAGGEFTGIGYPDGGHLFADPGLPDFNAGAAEQMFERGAEYLARWGRRCGRLGR